MVSFIQPRRIIAVLVLAACVCVLGFCAVWADRGIDFIIDHLIDARATNALGTFYAKGLLVGLAGALKYLALPLLLLAAFFALVFNRGRFALGAHLGTDALEDNTSQVFKALVKGVVVAVAAFVVGIPVLGAIAVCVWKFPLACAAAALVCALVYFGARRYSGRSGEKN